MGGRRKDHQRDLCDHIGTGRNSHPGPDGSDSDEYEIRTKIGIGFDEKLLKQNPETKGFFFQRLGYERIELRTDSSKKSVPESLKHILTLQDVNLLNGKFSADDTFHTARALRIFAFGLPAYMATKALSPFFYARGDTTTPVKIAVIGVALNTTFALILMQFWGYAGIAAATSLTVWINAGQYLFRLRKNPEFKLDKIFMYRVPRILLSNLVMGFVLWALLFFMPDFNSKILSVIGLLTIIVLGGISYIVALILTKGMPLEQLKNILKRKIR